MPDRYEIIDHTADIAIRTGGKDLNEAFANAAFAMFDTMCDAASVKPVGEFEVRVEGDDLELLLVNWLSELLYICDVDDVLFSCPSPLRSKEGSIRGRCRATASESGVKPPQSKLRTQRRGRMTG